MIASTTKMLKIYISVLLMLQGTERLYVPTSL